MISTSMYGLCDLRNSLRRAIQSKTTRDDSSIHMQVKMDDDQHEDDFDKENIWVIVISCFFLFVVMLGVLYRLWVLRTRRSSRT